MQKLGRSNEWISLFRILSNAYWLPDRHRVVTQMQKTHNAKLEYVGT